MDTRITFLLMSAIFIIIPRFIHVKTDKPPGIFAGMQKSAAGMFSRPLLWLMIISAVITPLWTASGLDVILQKIFQGWFPHRHPLMWPLFIVGNFWHIVPALLLYSGGWIFRKKHIFAAGAAGVQALFLSGWIVLGLKLLSGRRGPARFDSAGEMRVPFIRSTDPWDYQFDFWNRVFADGRFFWPSGHTATIFAFVSALAALYPQKRWITYPGYFLAFFMALLMTVGNFHWSSDVIAGALIGHAAGWSAGKEMRKRLECQLPAD